MSLMVKCLKKDLNEPFMAVVSHILRLGPDIKNYQSCSSEATSHNAPQLLVFVRWEDEEREGSRVIYSEQSYCGREQFIKKLIE